MIYHYYSFGSWLAHTVASGFIYRAIWSATRGLSAPEIIALAVVAVGILWAMRRAGR
jgi:hypothetical protein